MWQVLERLANLERRVAALYAGFAYSVRHLPPVAAFWREMAADEDMHALVIAAAREVFPPSASPPSEDWARQLAVVEALLDRVEAQLERGLSPAAAFACADEIECSELNAVTGLILQRAGGDFSDLVQLGAYWPVDRHREKVARGWERATAYVRGARAA